MCVCVCVCVDGSSDNGCLSGQQTVAVCMSECAWLSRVDWSRVYIWMSLWPFHYLLPINLSMQAHTEASQCLFMLNGHFYGCRDVHGCLLTRNVYMLVWGICKTGMGKAEINATATVLWVMLMWTWLSERYLLHIFIVMKQKSLLTATPTWQYILHQDMHNAIPVFMLIAACTIITAIGNKTGKTTAMVGANDATLCVYDFHCPVKCERQHSFAIIVAPLRVLNQLIIKYQL